ncbi:hypothetical protein I550_0827 [Mycobacterium intracellulare 1956]|uniref:Uncharacterized protein n=3 Tax=Mycobacterium intracellulare TaxID=1767 RepID=X8CNS0_MYCIT|nr:hypothetical protein OCU_09880 [Mycobacterium intracellulare ATCC 13950]AFC52510.1 hypothetical protein OCQ_09970 [Mycobacterium paraintracellulare]AFS13124.1 Hypothetical protein MIP_01623 [Mycobacterium intracellulare subsp. intracellulare MTCC 9506]ETZ38697.1 hypothetical protein L843_1192 [Mycobacterium intracellulare MIN_061107_1834]EUA57699.1 hypothetical protein I550_0827 [Mycobacterium intracellulare 1956]
MSHAHAVGRRGRRPLRRERRWTGLADASRRFAPGSQSRP